MLVTQDRRNDYDVTNTVQVSDPVAVRNAVGELFTETFPGASFDKLWLAFYDFARLFSGQYPGYLGCDTTYHDMQHTLDMTLALARLVTGYERSVDPAERLGAHRAQMTIITSLFHDAGYIRNSADNKYSNGAEVSKFHISRSAKWLKRYLPRIGMASVASVAAEIVHFTGYEKPLNKIELENPKDSMLGHLLGTADLIAQMSDRCYLEKCRDRLYLEFVLGGIAIEGSTSDQQVRYQSGTDLLLQTPSFYKNVVKKRLDVDFNKAYRYVEAVFDGHNPYLEFIERNIAYLEYIIETGEWPALRRIPPCFTVHENPLSKANALVNRHISKLRETAIALG